MDAEGNNETNTPEETNPDVTTMPEGTPAEGQISDELAEGEYYISEGVKGEGDKPEWFKSDKYNTITDQAKAYKDLEGKFGAFTGAPKDGIYDTKEAGEQLKEVGFEVDPEDPLLQEFTEYAKNSNMSQEGFNEGLMIYAKGKEADKQAYDLFKDDQIKALGDNSETIINDMKDWGKANLPEEHQEGFLEAFPTTASIQMAQALIAMTQGTPINPSNYTPTAGTTLAEIEAMQFEKDDNGNRRTNTDPAFKKRYEEARKAFHGNKDDVTIVG